MGFESVVATTVKVEEDDQAILAVAGCSDQDGADDTHYYILLRNGSKLALQEYRTTDNKVVRKIKTGHLRTEDDEDGTDGKTISPATLVVTNSFAVVRTRDSGVRVVDRSSGKKTRKIKSKSSGAASDSPLGMACYAEGDSNVLATAQDAGTIVLYDLPTCNQIAKILPQKSMWRSSPTLQVLVTTGGDNQMTILADNTLISADKSSHNVLTSFSAETSVAFILRRAKVFALVHQRAAECKGQWVDIEDESLASTVELDKFVPQEEDVSQSASKKRKTTETTILGPVQAGAEAKMAAKKVKVTDDDDDDEDMADADNDVVEDDDDDAKNITIAERLQMLREALDDDDELKEGDDDDGDEGVDFVTADKKKISFKPQQATTESLKELLSQALQSSDDSLLELALMVRDQKTISLTIKEMDGELLVILLGKLTSRLASTPLRAEALSVWISNCLKRGTFNPKHLAVLRNLLYERIESFSDLLRLEGRLSMMVD